MKSPLIVFRAGVCLLLVTMLTPGCGGGSGPPASPLSAPAAPTTCDGSCATASSFLTVTDVESVLARAVAEAQARNARGTIAVTDRLGNVLAVFRMTGASATVTLRTTPDNSTRISGGLEGVNIVPASMAAIAKAVTGAYLSSEGNAFSTRTASQIIQAHFNPGESLAASGPLFGVQFSQLPCSDLSRRFVAAPGAGPYRSPLGLAADPGGFPLYKAGTPVGGVGVVADGVYGLDADIRDRDVDLDEAIAMAATVGLDAPEDRRADRITVDGKLLRYTDLEPGGLLAASSPSFASINGAAGSLIAVPGYATAGISSGLAFGRPASGIRADSLDYPGLDAFVLVDDSNVERYRPRAGSEASGALAANDVRTLMRSALHTANRARAQIRRPLGTAARVSISIVDSNGTILAIARTRDAPVFGTDVALQKARSAAFFSSGTAASVLAALPAAAYLNQGTTVLRREAPAQYVAAARAFTGLPNLLGDGQWAFTARAVGNLSRPYYPDGVDTAPAGPWSKRAGEWSPFSTGLQLDVIYNALIQHVAYVAGLGTDVGQNCSGVGGIDVGFPISGASGLLANGIQIFPGGVPVYRGTQLVGAVGVSGDGIDQDDMVAFLGIADAAVQLAGIGHAPVNNRVDQLAPQGSRLRYVSCPQAPFLDSSVQEPCRGL